MEIALNSDTPGDLKHENAIASQNGLALLASITLKNALNINNNNNRNKNNNTKDKHSTLNDYNRINIKNFATPQPQHGFISSPTIASSSSLSSTPNSKTMQTLEVPKQTNVFTFTTAGLQALAANNISSNQIETGKMAVDQQQQQQQQQQQNNQKIKTLTIASTALPTVESLCSYPNNNINNNNNHTSLSMNHQETNKIMNVALLEALSINANKKQQNVYTQQQQLSANSTTMNTTATAHLSAGSGGNNNSNNGNGNSNSNKSNFRIPSDILDDLASRFIINVPDMELSNLIRICFQIELAHWFYLDFFCSSEDEKKLQPCGMKQFSLQLFEHIPFLRQHLSSIDKILEDWKNYKLSVPTYGAILISEDLNYCLLVQSYFAKSSWGFPKGKVNENEDPVHCATREVYEETGYDITKLIVPNDYIEAVINYQYTRLYIVRDVSLETKFSPRTRNEIKCCDWFRIDSLPVNKTDAISKPKLGINANSFFMIMPFVKRLKKWVNDKRNGVDTRRKYSGGGSPISSTSPLTTPIIMNSQIKSSCKKQQKRNNLSYFNDDINALKNGGTATTTSTTTTPSNVSSGNNASANINCSNSNSNRSKRQRHKSMGDLDGIKLNNVNNCNNQTNCKSTNINNNKYFSATTSSATTAANSSGNISCNNINTNNQKRHSKIVAAGSNVSHNFNNNNNNSNNNNGCSNNNNGSNLSSKRQLFQSQSQTNNLLQNGEKIVSSFDLIRKEKQQMKIAVAKAQKQQQNLNNNGRQRAKSQSDKMCMQQQQQQQQQQQLQQQQQQQKYSGNGNNNNNNNHSSNRQQQQREYETPTPPPIGGKDALTLAAAAEVGVTSVVHAARTTTTVATDKPQHITKLDICGQQKPSRPSSVSLHFSEGPSIKKESKDTTVTGGHMEPKLNGIASGTNIRILRRSTSHQPTQQTQQTQPPQRQASTLQFTPSFNSWTNFTFTKNFISNVFC